MRKWSYWIIDPDWHIILGIMLVVFIGYGFVSGDLTIICDDCGNEKVAKEEQISLHEQVKSDREEELRRLRLERAKERGNYECTLDVKGNGICNWVKGGE